MTEPLDHPPGGDTEGAGAAPKLADAPAPAADADGAPDVAAAADVTGTPARRRSIGPFQLALATVALLAGAALFLSGYSLGARVATTPGTPAAEAELFAPFWDVYESITKSYVGEVDRERLVQGAIDGMIGALDDPFSSYMSPEEIRRQREAIGGEFSGIGAEVTTRSTAPDGGSCDTIGPDCAMVVVAPIDGSPAERAGLLAGDVVTAVDGRPVAGETLAEAIDRIRGPKGSTVTITLVRDGGAPFDLAIVRDTIVQRQVDARELAGGTVTYLRASSISDNAAAQIRDALREARERGVTRFVVDLRDNPGGFVTGARSIASEFIADGPVFWEEGADGTQTPTNVAPGGLATGDEIQVVVLVNGGTASASEMIAGALQDTGRGILVGEQTFGKGTIQQWIDLSATSGGFRLSIAKWLTPDRRWIHEEGLTPDVVVPAGGAGAGEPGPTGDPYIDAALGLLDAEAAVPRAERRAA